MKVCVYCQRRLGHKDLLDRESKSMEDAGAAIGLEGLHFQYYTCPSCGHDHVFLEVVQLPGETGRDIQLRTDALARAVQEVERVRTTILVVEQGVNPS